MIMPGRSSSSQEYRYGYQGSLKDNEITGQNQANFSTFFREGDTRLGRWWAVDPYAFISPKESPYSLMGDNPICNTDVDGDDLDVKKNRRSQKDIKSLASVTNRKYIEINEHGNVSLNFAKISKERLQKILSKDLGLQLVKRLVDADEKFLYEATDNILIRDESGNKVTGRMKTVTHKIINTSNNGYDSNWAHTHRPRDGYDAQVIISPNARFTEDGNQTEIKKPRYSLIFHELSESYYKTHHGIAYNGYEGAHVFAIMDEMRWNRHSNTPGVLSDYPTYINPSKKSKKRDFQESQKYLYGR